MVVLSPTPCRQWGTSRPVDLPDWKETWHLVNMGLNELQDGSGRCWEGKTSPIPVTTSRFHGRPTCPPVTRVDWPIPVSQWAQSLQNTTTSNVSRNISFLMESKFHYRLHNSLSLLLIQEPTLSHPRVYKLTSYPPTYTSWSLFSGVLPKYT